MVLYGILSSAQVTGDFASFTDDSYTVLNDYVTSILLVKTARSGAVFAIVWENPKGMPAGIRRAFCCMELFSGTGGVGTVAHKA